jgi:hypothetical protein
MKFDILAKKIYLEARGPDEPERDLPERATVTGEFSIGAAGARTIKYLPKKPSPEETAVSRGKARETEFELDQGQKIIVKGDLDKRKSILYGVAAGEAFKRLKAKDFVPKTIHEAESVREFMERGMDEKLADAQYLLGRILRNLLSLYDLAKEGGDDSVKVEKKIKILSDEGDVLTVTTIPLLAKETLKLFKDGIAKDLIENHGLSQAFLIDENNILKPAKPRGNQENEITLSVRLGWKHMIANLIQLTGTKGKEFVTWSRTTRQDSPSINVLALDYRSTPTNWIIHTRKRIKDIEKGGYLRMLYKPKAGGSEYAPRLKSDWPSQKENNGKNFLPLKFVDGVPQYGVQLTEDEMDSLTVEQTLELVGYDTIWDVVYAWNRGDASFQIPNTNKKINLKNLTISRYRLSDPPKERRKTVEKIAKTTVRPEYRPLPKDSDNQMDLPFNQ